MKKAQRGYNFKKFHQMNSFGIPIPCTHKKLYTHLMDLITTIDNLDQSIVLKVLPGLGFPYNR